MKTREIGRNSGRSSGAKDHAPEAAPIAVLDASYLDRQVFGDKMLGEELLRLYAEQLVTLAPTIRGAPGAERREAAHKLKGASLAIGALALARLCETLETDPAADAGQETVRQETVRQETLRQEATLLIETTRRRVAELLECGGRGRAGE